MKLSIRAATSTDLPAMMALEKHAATAAHWSAQQYGALFRASNPGRIALVIQVENQQQEAPIQGFLVARPAVAEWEIENIAIAGPARRRGLGTRLLGEFLDLARATGRGVGISRSARVEPRGACIVRKMVVHGKRASQEILQRS